MKLGGNKYGRFKGPPKVKYFFEICYCSLLSLLVCMYWPFSTTTPSQIEIFSVIVACSYVLAFQDHNTLPN